MRVIAPVQDPVWIRPMVDGVPPHLGFPSPGDIALLPSSKSHAQRMLLLAALLAGTHEVADIGAGLDVAATLRAIRSLGADIAMAGDRVRVVGVDAAQQPPVAEVDCAENGTLLRALGTIVPALGGAVSLDAAGGLRRRPLQALFQAWDAMGISHDKCWPLRTRLPVAPPRLPGRVDGSSTTQVATGLLLALAVRGGGTLVVESPGSRDYLQVTAQVLRGFGFAIESRQQGADLVVRVGARAMRVGAHEVPRDPSARAFVAALAAMHRVPMPAAVAVPAAVEHPDAAVDDDLLRLLTPGAITLGELAMRPDSVPAIASAAASRTGTTHMPGLATLRGKESDRLDQLARGLSACGAKTLVVADGLVVTGPLPRSGAAPVVVDCASDHRIVMALALLGTILPAGIVLPHASCVAKSWPAYWDWLGRVATVVRGPGAQRSVVEGGGT